MAARRRPVIWPSDAQTDLVEIWSYYVAIAGRDAANRIRREIVEACRILEDDPLVGRAREEIRPGLRSIVSRPYVIFYRAPEGVAEIVRVLDGRRDIDEIFAEDV
jgi:toxin ParE1/3/4